MIYRTFLASATILIASCSDPTSSAPVAQTSNPPVSASALTYSTRVGTFQVQLPDGYVSVKSSDPAFFAAFRQRMPKLEIVDVFLTKGDLERSKTPDLLMHDQLVQLQIFPTGAPLVTDDMWGPLREQLPPMISGTVGRAHVRSGMEQADSLPQQPGSQLRIQDMAVGDLVVYSNTEESVRWATSANFEIEGSEVRNKAVLASAARRVGNNIYLVQTTQQVSSEQETLRAVSSLDNWLTRISATPN